MKNGRLTFRPPARAQARRAHPAESDLGAPASSPVAPTDSHLLPRLTYEPHSHRARIQ